jgi:hypothetical protein
MLSLIYFRGPGARGELSSLWWKPPQSYQVSVFHLRKDFHQAYPLSTFTKAEHIEILAKAEPFNTEQLWDAISANQISP